MSSPSKACCLSLVVLAALRAEAQEPKYLPFRMISTAQSPFPYYLDNRNPAPAGFSVTTSRPAVEAAWNEWNGVLCSMPKAASQGFTSGTVPNPPDRYDAFSVTPVWITDSSDPDARALLDQGFTLAISIPQSYGGVLQTCDIFLNGLIYTYSTTATTGATDVDVQTVMTHEAGHCLGLDHFGFGVMQGNIVKGEQKRQLLQLDVRGLCERNPLVGAPGSACLGDGGCNDATLRCVNRTGTIGPSRFCANACVPNTVPCALPLECQPSNAFAPTSTNACQYPMAGVTQVGKACTQATQCGSAVADCQLPLRNSTTMTVSWQGGYCTQGCEVGQPACPPGTQCANTAQNTRICVASCRVGLADCRPEYACEPISATSGNAGVCIPKCVVDADCLGPNTTCRLCDGRCIARQNPSGKIGDVCSADTQCGAGQVCRPADPNFTTKQCTQSCARGCGTCPVDSACVPDARGELFCLKTCSGRGGCGVPTLRCNDFPGVKACIPSCRDTLDCPVGQQCVAGECEIPVDPEDAGCTTFCNVPDAGRPFMPRPDAGPVGGGGYAGCGCSTKGAFEPMLAFAVLVLAARRRRSWDLL